MLLFEARLFSLVGCKFNLFNSVCRQRHFSTQINKQIIQKIKINGPLPVSEFMKIVLTSPLTGFYMRQDVFGKRGHFTTSPEISQIFGELVGVWLINEWQRFNSTKPFRIVELGPGRGTLASDISRVLTKFGGSKEHTSLHLVEVSPFLVQLQEKNLCGQISILEIDSSSTHESLTESGMPVTWYRSLDQVPESSGFTAYIAHEFFDALPIHKFQKNSDNEWREILVDYDKNEELNYIMSKSLTPASKLLLSDPNPNFDHLEICPDAALIIEKICDCLSRNDGCFLICDYGYDNSDVNKSRDTFRGFRDHSLWDPLKEPGTADLTADVDFDYLKQHAQQKALTFGPVPQKHFLNNLGLNVRLQNLMAIANEREKEELISGVKMIMEDMGLKFKFMSIFPKNSKHLFDGEPPGFSPL